MVFGILQNGKFEDIRATPKHEKYRILFDWFSNWIIVLNPVLPDPISEIITILEERCCITDSRALSVPLNSKKIVIS